MITAELAGVNRDDIHLEISSQAVKISGKRAERVHGERSRYHLAEIPYGYFERTLSIASTIDTEGVTARHADGLLEIRIPKLPSEKPNQKNSDSESLESSRVPDGLSGSFDVSDLCGYGHDIDYTSKKCDRFISYYAYYAE